MPATSMGIAWMIGLILALSCGVSGAQHTAQEPIEHANQVAIPPCTAIPAALPGVEQPAIPLDGLWRFNPSADAIDATPGTSGWAQLTVPGQWSQAGHEVPEGDWAAYAREFNVPDDWSGHRITLRFEAVFSRCEVLVNGHAVGTHEGGFTAFEVDATDAAHIGTNQLLVRVQGRTDIDKLASASQYAVHDLGGITRPVTLFALPQTHLAAVRVRTDLDADYRDATLLLDILLEGAVSPRLPCSIDIALVAPGAPRQPAASMHQELDEPGAALLRLDVPSPRLWDPEHPRLYDLVVQLHQGDRLLEMLTQRVGLREIEVRGSQFLVNGSPIKLRGVNRHEIDPLRGRVVSPELARLDATLFRDANVNYIRTSHYPPTRAFLDACDELGLVVECEAPICWMQHGANPNWTREDWVYTDRGRWLEPIRRQNLESIAFNFNHPSIIMWSLANESAWSELWAETLASVLAADPSRPATFHDQCWGSYNNLGSNAPVANMHYPGPRFWSQTASQTRAVLFGEYAHLNAYNRRELLTDPGVRDAWGPLLRDMWERMRADDHVIGGAIWSGIDDLFIMPDGTTVGYGEWGPIDAYRRPKAEYWHMKQTYSPVRASLTPGGRLAVENRHDFTDLAEITVRWAQGERAGPLFLALPPRASAEFDLPPEIDPAGEPLELRFLSPRGFEIDRVRFPLRPTPPEPEAARPPGQVRQAREGETLIVSCAEVSFKIDTATGAFLGLFLGDRSVLRPGLHFMLIPLNGDGDTQMTPDMEEVLPFNPFCVGWQLGSVIAAPTPDGAVRVEISGRYEQLKGAYGLTLDAQGRLTIEYDWTVLAEVNPRQWGVSLEVPREQDRLDWSRDAEWTTYPDDHIGRPVGWATPDGIVTPRGKWPDHSWSLDASPLGSNDFRSTKRAVRRVTLTDPGGVGVELTSGGTQASRCWIDGDRIRWLLAGYDNPGAERFLRAHAAPFDRPLHPGDRISDRVSLRVRH